MSSSVLKRKKVQLVLFAAALIFLLAQFIAPMTLEPHTVEGLDANANMIDYADKWRELPPFQRAVYWFGDLNCHQKASRSFEVNDNQMPMCTRDVGVFTGFPIGFLLLWPAVPGLTVLGTTIQVIPRRLREPMVKRLGVMGTAVVLGAVFLMPLAFDGFLQLLTSYESTNMKRLLTGMPFGMMLGVALGGVILTMVYYPLYPPGQGVGRGKH